MPEVKKCIGVSIYPEVILNMPSSRMHKQILADFADGNTVLPWLKQMGVDSIELRMLNGKLSPDDYVHFLEKVWQEGLHTTIHGVLPETAPEQYVSLYQRVLSLSCDHQRETVFTVHSLGSGSQTKAALCALAQTLKAYPGLRLSLENQRIHDAEHLHFSMSGVAENAAASHAGITWDMGHYAFNIQKEIDALPPRRILSQVIHTHIHSLDDIGNTHHHLSEFPVKGYIEALEECGYSGIYNLELFSKTYPETLSPRKTLEDAVCLLKKMLK